MMQAFLICKAKEDNFLAYNVAGNSSHAKLQIRRLSLTSTDSNVDEDVVSQTRSLVVSGKKCKLDGVPFKAFKKLRVLEIKSSRLENGHLVDICGLILLRSLVLNGCRQITELPREIGRLQKLETLHVAGTHISKLPTEIGKLKHLETLDVSRTEVMELPTCIEKLQSLKTLNVSGTKVRELPVEIRKLKHLRNLDMRYTKVRVLPWDVQNSINVHVGDLDSVKMEWAGAVSPDRVISSSSGANYRRALSIMLFDPLDERCEKPLQVPLLRVAGRHMKVPQWVKQDLCNVCSLDISLCKLGEDDLEFLKRHMPNLQALKLRLEVLPREPVAITRGGFSKLETFYVDCRLPRVITFKEGAMPKLKHLEFKFYTGTARQDYSMGIMHLPSLKSIEFRCSDHYSSDGPGIAATIEAMRKEATEHPNCIILFFTDRMPEVFRSGAKWISQADRAVIQKETEERERMKKQREHLYNAAKRRAEPNENNATGTSDLSRLECSLCCNFGL
jgi:Sec-independent protein translocase protein TatA